MDRLKKRFAILVAPVALIMFASFLVAQTPNPCAKTCQQIYAGTVKSCHGDQACLAAARAVARACVQGCGLPR